MMIWSSRTRRCGLTGKRAPELLREVAVVDLDVARLVGHLVGGVPLGFFPGHALHDLGRREQRPLLAVQELRQHPGVDVEVELGELRCVEFLRWIEQLREDIARAVLRAIRGDLLDVDVGRPIEVSRIPRRELPLFVQIEKILALEGVLPVEDGLHRRRYRLEGADVWKRDGIALFVLHEASSVWGMELVAVSYHWRDGTSRARPATAVERGVDRSARPADRFRRRTAAPWLGGLTAGGDRVESRGGVPGQCAAANVSPAPYDPWTTSWRWSRPLKNARFLWQFPPILPGAPSVSTRAVGGRAYVAIAEPISCGSCALPTTRSALDARLVERAPSPCGDRQPSGGPGTHDELLDRRRYRRRRRSG